MKAPRKDLQQRLKTRDHYDTPLEMPYLTHWLNNMDEDRVLKLIKDLGIANHINDKVKVIFVPCYLDGKDGIFGKQYYDLLLGQDLSIYPSYYEPWGYTPLESIAFAVPTVTTDLAGFGLWVNSLKEFSKGIESGVEVIHRTDTNYFDVAEGIKDAVSSFSDMTAEEVQDTCRSAVEISEKALWKHFIAYYYKAYDLALRRAEERRNVELK